MDYYDLYGDTFLTIFQGFGQSLQEIYNRDFWMNFLLWKQSIDLFHLRIKSTMKNYLLIDIPALLFPGRANGRTGFVSD